jgi:hypothetical protein
MEKHQPLFIDNDGIYNYCPTILQEGKKRHYFYCSNLIPFKIIDHIAYQVATLNSKNQYEFASKGYVLEPDVYDLNGWDHVHDCDPSVIGGKFYFDNQEYKYCMAFLGCNTLDCTINEVGLAFASNIIGPWHKYDKNPYVSFSLKDEGRYWGVGQPCIVSIDKQGKFRLFYTKGYKEGTHTFFIDCDFSLNGKGTHTKPIMVKEEGLLAFNKNEELLNGDFMYDEEKDGYYCVRDTRYRDGLYPNFIAPFVQIDFAHSTLLTNNEGKWVIIDNIDETKTGFKRNHNAGLVRDLYGWKIKDQPLEVIYTSSILATSNEDLKYLWSYRLHSYVVKNQK